MAIHGLNVSMAVFIGLSARTNPEAAAQLAELLEPHGYRPWTIPVAAGLHLKSSVSWLGGQTLLLCERFADRPEFRAWRRIVVPAAGEPACNTLLVNGTLLMPAGFPEVRRQLEQMAMPVVELDVSEVRKMDGGLTCLSLRL